MEVLTCDVAPSNFNIFDRTPSHPARGIDLVFRPNQTPGQSLWQTGGLHGWSVDKAERFTQLLCFGP